MFRRVLTYQLMLAVAVGPMLCCCSAGQLLASITPSLAGAKPALQAPIPPTAPAARSCCAHKHKPAKPNGDHGDPKPGDKCPCKDGSDKPETVPTEMVSADVSALLRVLTLDFVAPFTTVFASCGLTPLGQDAVGSPHPNATLLSTADLLFAHHNLRC